MIKENKKTPEIRFPGFTEDWEQRKLDDMVEFLDTQRKPLEGSKRVSGPYPYYGASGVVDYVDDYIFDEELVLLSEDGANITDRNYPVCFIISGKTWVNNHAHVLKTKTGFDNYFLCNSLERKDYTPYNTGMAMPKLNKEVCKNIPVECPSYEEQLKIGAYLDSLDTLITLHQRKCDALQTLKKSMLQKMFPKKGSSVPEIRFPSFTEDWEQRKFGEVLETVTDYVAAGSFADLAKNVEYHDKPDYAQLVRTMDLKNGFTSSQEVFVDENAFNYLYRVNLDKECIILPNIGNCGEVYFVRPEALPHKHNVLGPNAILVRSETNSNLFLSTLFQAKDFQTKLSLIVSPNGQTKFNKTELKQIELLLPNSEKEQNKIGEYFANLDNLITLHQRKANAYKKLKKAMMQQLFV